MKESNPTNNTFKYCILSSSSLGNDDCHGRTDANVLHHLSWFLAFDAAPAGGPIHAFNISNHLMVRGASLPTEITTLPKRIFSYRLCWFFLAHGQHIP